MKQLQGLNFNAVNRDGKILFTITVDGSNRVYESTYTDFTDDDADVMAELVEEIDKLLFAGYDFEVEAIGDGNVIICDIDPSDDENAAFYDVTFTFCDANSAVYACDFAQLYRREKLA